MVAREVQEMRLGSERLTRPSLVPADGDRDWSSFGPVVAGWTLGMDCHEPLQYANDRHLGTLLFPARDRVMVPAIEADGTWEPSESAWLERSLRPGQTFLNIGANVGYHVVRASRLVGPAGRVIAIEPDPVNFAFLLTNLALQDLRNVVPIWCAAGAEAADLRLYRADDNSGDNRLTPFPEASTSVDVRVERMDALLAGQRIDVALVDTQGWDHEVVAGMTGLFADGLVPMIVEFTPSWLRDRAIDPVKVVEDFQALGYRIGVLEADLAPGVSAEEAVRASDVPPRYYANLELQPGS
jgi:FkbM family methyltransferase